MKECLAAMRRRYWMIRVIKDKDAFWEVDKYDVVLLGCSIYCMIESGFGGKLKNRFPVIQEADDQTPYADTRKLGKRLTLHDMTPVFSLLYVCKFPLANKPSVDYDALEKCLTTANAEFRGKKVITTILGAGRFDGLGDKVKCLEMMERCCPDLEIDVYDYEQLTMKEEKKRQFDYIKSLRSTNPELHKYLYDHQAETLEKLYIKKKNGKDDEDNEN